MTEQKTGIARSVLAAEETGEQHRTPAPRHWRLRNRVSQPPARTVLSTRPGPGTADCVRLPHAAATGPRHRKRAFHPPPPPICRAHRAGSSAHTSRPSALHRRGGQHGQSPAPPEARPEPRAHAAEAAAPPRAAKEHLGAATRTAGGRPLRLGEAARGHGAVRGLPQPPPRAARRAPFPARSEGAASSAQQRPPGAPAMLPPPPLAAAVALRTKARGASPPTPPRRITRSPRAPPASRAHPSRACSVIG